MDTRDNPALYWTENCLLWLTGVADWTIVTTGHSKPLDFDQMP